MLQNYLKVAIRSLLKNKVFPLINLLGLTIGISSCMLLLAYVQYESSYDNFHENADQIYRIHCHYYENASTLSETATVFSALGPTLKEKLPEVLEFTRAYFLSSEMALRVEDKTAQTSSVLFVDRSFLEIFSYPMLAGDKTKALTGDGPVPAVINQSLSDHFFSNALKAIEKKMIFIDSTFDIKGVIQIPENSHIQPEVLIPFEFGDFQNDWQWLDFYTYILVRPATNKAQLEKSINTIATDFMGKDRADHMRFSLISIKNIHLSSNAQDEFSSKGSLVVVNTLKIIAVGLLLIAFINYVNLSVVRAMQRYREIGMRKVVGARKRQLFVQFIFEAYLMIVTSALLSLIIIRLIFPVFIYFIDLPMTTTSLYQPFFWVVLGIVVLVGGLVTGIYPALIISRFQPTVILKAKLTRSGLRGRLRKVLVVFQFFVSAVLIISIWVVFQQLYFMQSQPLGVNIENVLIVNPTYSEDDHTIVSKNFETMISQFAPAEKISNSYFIP
ncbi:ABC transporter permease, partial [Fulvivirga sp. RKSG066]|uniref:ABC transporter permease n=1 Tax=Fulvivirga aurantia TaxID=2529383 RepID=UPI0012BB817C